MKTVYALLVCLCLLFTIAGALAQQQSANSGARAGATSNAGQEIHLREF